MKLSKLYILCCLAVCCTQCSPSDDVDFPLPSEGEPVFMVQTDINGRAIDLAAGLNDYYMFTSFERDAQNVLTFIGDLKQQTCPDICAEQLRIEIRDRATSEEGTPSELLVLEEDILFAQPPLLPSIESYRASFYAEAVNVNSSPFVYAWSFGDGAFSTEQNPVHHYNIPDEYEVELMTIDGDSCVSSQKQVIHLEQLDENCAVSISADFVQNNQIQLTAESGGELTNNLYIWSQDSSVLEGATIFPNGSGLFCVQLIDDNSCASSSCATVLQTGGFSNFCTTSFSYEIETIEESVVADTLQLSTITVIYTDTNGREYRSDLGQQEEAIFNIKNVENYDPNENGEKTKRIDFDLACSLYSENGAVLELKDGTFTFALAHP